MVSISVKMEEAEKEALQQYADENDLSMSQVVRRALREFIQKENN